MKSSISLIFFAASSEEIWISNMLISQSQIFWFLIIFVIVTAVQAVYIVWAILKLIMKLHFFGVEAIVMRTQYKRSKSLRAHAHTHTHTQWNSACIMQSKFASYYAKDRHSDENWELRFGAPCYTPGWKWNRRNRHGGVPRDVSCGAFRTSISTSSQMFSLYCYGRRDIQVCLWIMHTPSAY